MSLYPISPGEASAWTVNVPWGDIGVGDVWPDAISGAPGWADIIEYRARLDALLGNIYGQLGGRDIYEGIPEDQIDSYGGLSDIYDLPVGGIATTVPRKDADGNPITDDDGNVISDRGIRLPDGEIVIEGTPEWDSLNERLNNATGYGLEDGPHIINPTFPSVSSGGSTGGGGGGGTISSTDVQIARKTAEQGPNPIWDPINRQYGTGALQRLLGFGGLLAATRGGYAGVPTNPTLSAPVSQVGPQPPRMPGTGTTPTNVPSIFPDWTATTDIQNPSPTEGISTDAGGGGPRIFPSPTLSATASPGTSTDGGGGGPRAYTGDTGRWEMPTDGSGPGQGSEVGPEPPRRDIDGDTPTPNPYKDMNLGNLDTSRIIPRTQGTQLPEMYAFQDEFYQPGGLQESTIANQQGSLQQAHEGLGWMQDFYSGAGGGILQDAQGVMGQFFGSDPTYEGLTGAMSQANPLIGGITEQGQALGQSAMDLISSAGVLNERERANVQDQARALFGARGRGEDTAAIATEIGDVIEAERLDERTNLASAAGLMGAQQGAAETVSGLQNQFVRDFLNAGQTFTPGMNVASNIGNVASSLGQDPWAMFGLEGQERQTELGLQAYEDAKDAAEYEQWAALLGAGGTLIGSMRGNQMGGYNPFGGQGAYPGGTIPGFTGPIQLPIG